METSQLQQLIDKLPLLKRRFNGVVDVATINDEPAVAASKNGFAVIYIDLPRQKIGHYAAIYSFDDDELKFFDSFGQPPSTYGMNLRCPYNDTQLQSESSCLCGGYIAYCLNASINRRVPVERVVETDFKTLRYNDSLIHEWLSKLGIRNLLRCK